jgi:hypothetical protein
MEVFDPASTRYIAYGQIQRKKALFRNNSSIFIAVCLRLRCIESVACVFVVAGMCLPSCCLALDNSDFIIPAFGRHVTVCFIT